MINPSKKDLIASQHIEYLKKNILSIPMQIKKAQSFIDKKQKELIENELKLKYFTND